MRRINTKDVVIVMFILMPAIWMIFDLQKFQGSIAGTIGPGIFPLVTILLMIVSGIFIIIKAFVPTRYALHSPFAAGSLDGLVAKKVSQILTRAFKERVLIKSQTGQGYFSAYFSAIRSKADGCTFLIITGEHPSTSCIRNAKLALDHFEPITQLGNDPYVFVARNNSEKRWHEELKPLLKTDKIGFSFQKETADPLAESLSACLDGAVIQRESYDSTLLMLEDIINEKITLGLCPLSDIGFSSEDTFKYQIVGVGTAERLTTMPGTPTFRELSIDRVCGNWTGIVAPKGVSRSSIDKIWNLISLPENLKELTQVVSEHGERENIKGPQAFRDLLELQAESVENITSDSFHFKPGFEMKSLKKVIGGILLFVFFMILAPYLGYLATALGFMILLSLMLWPQKTRQAVPLIFAVSIGSTLAIYYSFTRIFMVVFP